MPQLLKGGNDQWNVNYNSYFLWLKLLQRQKNPQVVQDQQSESACVGSTMTTSTRVRIPSLVSHNVNLSTKEWNMVEKNVCNFSHPTWKLASHVMAAKMSQTPSWVPLCSLLWA
jgi:hypothetical protein